MITNPDDLSACWAGACASMATSDDPPLRRLAGVVSGGLCAMYLSEFVAGLIGVGDLHAVAFVTSAVMAVIGDKVVAKIRDMDLSTLWQWLGRR